AASRLYDVVLYKEAHNDYRPVCDEALTVLEAARKESRRLSQARLSLKRDGFTYSVFLNFDTHEFAQHNDVTRVKRPLLLMDACWSAKRDDAEWQEIRPREARRLQAAFVNHTTTSTVSLHFQHAASRYCVDFTSMTLHNIATDSVLKLRRQPFDSFGISALTSRSISAVPPPPPPPPPPMTQTGVQGDGPTIEPSTNERLIKIVRKASQLLAGVVVAGIAYTVHATYFNGNISEIIVTFFERSRCTDLLEHRGEGQCDYGRCFA
ncbi:Hypothetical protein, putative, partial [Bodo saltans]